MFSQKLQCRLLVAQLYFPFRAPFVRLDFDRLDAGKILLLCPALYFCILCINHICNLYERQLSQLLENPVLVDARPSGAFGHSFCNSILNTKFC